MHSDETAALEHTADPADGPQVWIVEERPALREGEIFLDADERARISENLETAYTALGEAAEDGDESDKA